MSHVPEKSREPLLLWQLTNRGFGSEINVLLLAILYGWQNRLRFALSSRHSSLACERGWTDYFLPFCEEIESPFLRWSMLFRRDCLSTRFQKFVQRAALQPVVRRPFFLTHDVWDRIWCSEFVRKRFDLPDHGINGDCYTACRVILNSIWRFNERTRQGVLEVSSRLPMAGQPYFAIHIRRGDKLPEVKPLDARSYVDKVVESGTDLKRCFVMADDYGAVEDLRRLRPDWEFFSLCDRSKGGYSQSSFKRLPPGAKRREMEVLLAELTIAQASAFFVGTYSSNIGRLMALLKGRENILPVDMPYRMIY